MSTLSTHVLDTSLGRPAAGVEITLHELNCKRGEGWYSFLTDEDGRYRFDLTLSPGDYYLVFQTGAYFERLGKSTLYPEVHIAFTIAAGEQHYHIPLLLNPFGYTTYRGS